MIRNIINDNSIGPNSYIVTDGHIPDYFGSSSDITVVADARCPVMLGVRQGIGTNGYLLEDNGILTDACPEEI